MVNKLRVVIDKFLLDYHCLLHMVSFKLGDRYDFPTKRLVGYCLDNCFAQADEEGKHALVESTVTCIAHMYYYDSTVSKENLGLIHAVYDTYTRERVRQILCKFIRQYYRR